jgi:hypothetical protein
MSNNPMLAPMSGGVVPRAHYGDQQLARVLALATTNPNNLKTSPGTIEEIALFNTTASAIYVKFYDKATAPVPGTDTPAFTVQVPANGSAIIPAGVAKPFLTGVGYGITGAAADSDTTAVTAGSVTGYLLWS